MAQRLDGDALPPLTVERLVHGTHGTACDPAKNLVTSRSHPVERLLCGLPRHPLTFPSHSHDGEDAPTPRRCPSGYGTADTPHKTCAPCRTAALILYYMNLGEFSKAPPGARSWERSIGSETRARRPATSEASALPTCAQVDRQSMQRRRAFAWNSSGASESSARAGGDDAAPDARRRRRGAGEPAIHPDRAVRLRRKRVPA